MTETSIGQTTNKICMDLLSAAHTPTNVESITSLSLLSFCDRCYATSEVAEPLVAIYMVYTTMDPFFISTSVIFVLDKC